MSGITSTYARFFVTFLILSKLTLSIGIASYRQGRSLYFRNFSGFQRDRNFDLVVIFSTPAVSNFNENRPLG